jgi:tetratricopeptide (TPR) repeat protein
VEYVNKGDYDRAISDYTQALGINPNDAQIYNNRGNAYRSKKDYDRAIADYTQALSINPNDAGAYYYNRGWAYDDKGDYNRAIADYTEAIRLGYKYSDVYVNRGWAYHDKDDSDYARAIADANEAIRLNPNYARAYALRGNCHRLLHDNYSAAIRDFTQAIKLDPNYGWAKERLTLAQQVRVNNGISVSAVTVGNSYYDRKWINRPGERLTASAIRYLMPVITYNSRLNEEITVFVKIIGPDGQLKTGASSPSGYSYRETKSVNLGNNQSWALMGWGNSDTSIYSSGNWIVEVWFENTRIGRTTITLH